MKYFVQVETADTIINCVMTEEEIISRVSMRDCSEENLAVFRTKSFGEIEPLKVLGTWHNLDEPLLIEVVDGQGNVVISGYGVDH